MQWGQCRIRPHGSAVLGPSVWFIHSPSTSVCPAQVTRTLRLMTQNHLAGGQNLTQMADGAFSETAYEGVGFGLGFAMTLSEVGAGTLGAGDFYRGGAASTIFRVDPVENLAVVFMT